MCENCSSSGKECLFRIDDLSPALRLERFAAYGPPSENARQIGSTRKTARSSLARPRTTSSTDELSEANDAGDGSEEGANERKRQRTGSEGRAFGKNKAVFRSFANPTKLGAPSHTVSAAEAGHNKIARSPSMLSQGQRYSSPHVPVQQMPQYGAPAMSPHRSHGPAAGGSTYGYYQSTGYYEQAPGMLHQSQMQAQPHTFHDAIPQHHFGESRASPAATGSFSAYPLAPPSHEAGPWQYPQTQHTYSYSPSTEASYRTSALQSHEREQRTPSVASTSSQTALPSFRTAFSSLDSRPSDNSMVATPAASGLSRQQGGVPYRQRSASNASSRYHALTSPREGMGGEAAYRPATGMTVTGVYAPESPSSSFARHAPVVPYSRTPQGSLSADTALPPPTLSNRTPTLLAADMLPSGKHRLQAHASPSNLPSRNDLAASHGVNGASTGEEVKGSSRESAKQASSGSVDGSSSTNSGSRHPPTFKRIALPFFRWFGATANTPGIRRIKVGVYHETDVEELQDEEALPAQAGAPSIDAGLDSPALGSDAAAAGEGNGTTPRETFAKATPRYSQPGPESALSTSARELFESDRPRYPRRDILVALVNLFIKYFKASCFPWLDEAELVAGAHSGELPAILANSVCAITARFSNHVDLRRGVGKSSGEPFADMAKVLIVPMLSWPSVDVIEALVIISYAEFAAGADAGLWMYIGMALRMATDLGLQHEVTITSMANKKQQDRSRLLFWAIVGLDRITCFGTGRPVTVREDSFDCQLPPLEEEPSADGFVFGHIVRTLLKRGRIGELLNRRTDELSLEERGRKLRSMWLDLAEYYDSLPPTLHFGVNTFRKLAAANQGAAFVYLHVLLQSTMSLLNRPSLLRRFDRDFSISAPTKLASIANHASGTIVSILRFAEDARQDRAGLQEDKDENPLVNPYIDCNPYLDQLILPAGRAFLTEREAVRDALRRLGYAAQSRPVSRGAGDREESEAASLPSDGPFNGLIASRQYAQTNLATCQKILDRLALWWSGASWPARALLQETAGATGNDVEPEGNDEDAQPAPIRDVEMVLKWAKARVKRIRASNKTPAVSRRASADVQGGQAALAGEKLSVDVDQHMPSFLGSQYPSGDADTSSPDDSPLGLGFSGSFGTTTDIDIQALINAWADEHNFIDSTQTLVNPPTVHPQWGVGSHFDRVPGVEQAGGPPFDTPAGASLAAGAGVAAPSPHTRTPGMVDLDLNAMQLEEFFFKTELEQSGQMAQQTHNQATSSEEAMDDSGMLQGLDELPSALFNAFAYHAGTPTHDYNGQPARRVAFR